MQFLGKHKLQNYLVSPPTLGVVPLPQENAGSATAVSFLIYIDFELKRTIKGPFTLCVFCIICVKRKESGLYPFFAFDATSHRRNDAI